MDENKDYADDELINVKLPRKQFQQLQKMIQRDAAMTWLELKWKTHWVWVVGGGLVTLFILWDKIQAFVAKV